MKTKRENRPRKWLALETVIIVGLCLKLTLTAAFLIVSDHSPGLPLQVREAHAQEKGPDEPAGEAGPSAKPAVDPALTKQYQSLIDTLKLKEENLDRREQRIKEREKALALLEQDLQKRLDAIEEKRKELDALVEKHARLVEQQKIFKNARIEHLVTAYKGMRPEKAGTLVNSLDDDVAVDILSAMPGRAAGQILAFVDPAKAARLTKAIRERQVPETRKPAPVAGQPAAGEAQ